MSQSISVTSSPSIVRTFLSIFTPTVVWYLSANMLWTKRATRLVLPTPYEPSRQIFFFCIPKSKVARSPDLRGYQGSRSSGRAMAFTLQHAQVGAPGTDRVPILVCQHPRDLMQMSQIVNRPGGEKLRQSDNSEGGMASTPREIFGLQIQCKEGRQIVRTQPGEMV